MTIDRRLYPANDRVAHESLSGQVDGLNFTAGEQMTVAIPVADLLRSPGGGLDRQCLLGESVTLLEDHEGWSFVITDTGYVGYLKSSSLGDVQDQSHFVGTLSTWTYEDEDFKSSRCVHLPFGARVNVTDERRKFFETSVGFVPKSHLRPMNRPFEDPATVAQMHFGVPYLWGGNSTFGIDCSGLISAALRACGAECPGDSDMQANLGIDVSGALQRADLVFWKGHVGMMVDEETLIHANAHHMACRYEPFEQACLRIKAQGDGDVLARRRLI